MFFDDHKKKTTQILRKRNEQGAVGEPMSVKPEVMSQDEALDGRRAAAEDMMQAHMNKSPQHLVEALCNFIDLHLDERDRGASDDGIMGED